MSKKNKKKQYKKKETSQPNITCLEKEEVIEQKQSHTIHWNQKLILSFASLLILGFLWFSSLDTNVLSGFSSLGTSANFIRKVSDVQATSFLQKPKEEGKVENIEVKQQEDAKIEKPVAKQEKQATLDQKQEVKEEKKPVTDPTQSYTYEQIVEVVPGEEKVVSQNTQYIGNSGMVFVSREEAEAYAKQEMAECVDTIASYKVVESWKYPINGSNHYTVDFIFSS